MLWSGWQETTSSRVLRGCEPASGTQFLEPPTIVTFFKRVRIERAYVIGGQTWKPWLPWEMQM